MKTLVSTRFLAGTRSSASPSLRPLSPLVLCAALALLVLVAPLRAWATDHTFVPTRGDWNVAQNWDPIGVPEVDGTAIVTGNRTAVVASGTSAAVFNTFILDQAALENSGLFDTHSLFLEGTVSVLSGTLDAFEIFDQGTMLLDGGDANTFQTNISDGGSLVVNRGFFTGGFGVDLNGVSSPATLAVTGGHFFSYHVSVSGSSSQITVTSGTMDAGEFYMGGGTMDISGGVADIGGFFPSVSGGTIRVSGSGDTGGTFLFLGPFFLSGSELDILGGTASGEVFLSGSARVVMTSGVAHVSARIGSTGTDTSIWTISGGTWDTNFGGNPPVLMGDFIVGDRGKGQVDLTDYGTIIVQSGTAFIATGSTSAEGVLNIGTGGKAGSFQAEEVNGGPGKAILNFNHTGDYTFTPIITGTIEVNNISGRTILTGSSPNVGPVNILGGALVLGPGASIGSSSGITIAPCAVFDTTAVGNFVMPAGQRFTFGIDSGGTGSAGKIVAGGLDISSASVSFAAAGALDDPAYVIATYSTLYGSAFASVQGLPPGYAIDYAYNNGTQIALVSTNKSPVAVNDTASAHRLPVTIPVLANDSDPDGDALAVVAVTQGAHGSVAISGSQSVIYTPGSDFAASNGDTFTYTVSDGHGGSAQASVVVSKQNAAPVANPDFAIAGADPVTIPVLANDTDADGDALTIVSVTQGAAGSVTFTGTAVQYTPGAAGVADQFTYTVSDGFGGTATATVSISAGTPINIGVIGASPDGNGSPVAGEPEGTTLAKAGIPSLRDNGFKAFAAVLRTGSGFYDAILSGTDLRVFVRQNDPVPDANGNPITGAAFASFSAPLINDLGNTAFLAEIAGPSVSNKTKVGLWTDSFGALALVARTGYPAPGVGNAKLAAIDSVILEGGTGRGAFLAFTGRIAPGSGGTTGNNDAALWGVNAQGPSILLREGDAIAIGGSSAVIKRFVALGIVRGSPGQGRAADADSVVAHVYLKNGLEAILLLSPGTSPQIVATEGEAVPGLPSAAIAAFGTPSLTSTGIVGGLVQLGRQKGAIGNNNDTAILLGGSSGDYSQLLVREGDPAPGVPGAVFRSFEDPVINANGEAAFHATISGGDNSQPPGVILATQGGSKASTDGIWWGTPGNLKLLAKVGDPAPGTDGRFGQFVSVAYPNGGAGPLIVVSLSGPDKRVGLWATTSQGTLVLVAISGNLQFGFPFFTIDVLGIVPGSPAQPRSYNNQRQVIYKLTFENGNQRIITTAIP